MVSSTSTWGVLRTIADVQVQGDAIMTVESHLEFGTFAAIGRSLLTGPATSALSGLNPVVAAAARGLDQAGDEPLDKAITGSNGLGNPWVPAGLILDRIVPPKASYQLEGHEFDTHRHPHFFFTVHGHIHPGRQQDHGRGRGRPRDGPRASHRRRRLLQHRHRRRDFPSFISIDVDFRRS